MNELDELVEDLRAEQASLEQVLAGRSEADWARPTPAVGWSVSDQIAHLAYFDAAAAQAIEDPDAFAAAREELVRAALSVGVDEYTLGALRTLSSASIHAAWTEAATRLLVAASGLHAERRLAWYGPDMKARSFLTARLMETWAHGTDVADALGTHLPATARLRHIVRLGWNTRDWSYRVRAEEVPDARLRLALTSPGGETWVLGPDDADETLSGPAEDFCLVVTQRRHVDDTDLDAGTWARHWLLRAQAFAGAPTIGPAPRSR